MLIMNLGKTRRKLLSSLDKLSDDQLNHIPPGAKHSIAQIIHHLYSTERDTAQAVLEALPLRSEPVCEHDRAFLIERMEHLPTAAEPPAGRFTKAELIRLLEESRFRHLQKVFNETHETVLVDKSVHHPVFGSISLKNLVDFIWIHEERHIEQIELLKTQLPQHI